MRYKLGSKIGSSIVIIAFAILMMLVITGAVGGDAPILLAIYGTGLLLVVAFT